MSLQLIEATKYTRNRRAPINRLPDDVLEIIFRLARPYNAGFFPSWPISTKWSHRLLAVTHVCKRWRDVALGLASLWAVVDLCKQRRLGDVGEDLLQRSGNTLLDVFYLTHTPIEDQIARVHPALQTLVLNRAHHIASLHICNITLDALNTLLCTPLPSLGVLSLVDIIADSAVDDGLSDTTCTPFAELTPRLRKLAIAYHMPAHIQHSVSHLTHLALYYTGQISTRDGLLDILERSPHLQYLLIVDPTNHTGTHVPASIGVGAAHRRIPLPHLRRVYLYDVWMSEIGISRLLSFIDVPDDCDLRIKSGPSYNYMDVRISLLPSPADLHILQHIRRVVVEIAAQETEDERRRHSCMAVHSGTLFVTVHCSIDNLTFPAWAVGSDARLGVSSDAHLVIIILARLRPRSTLLPEILNQWPQLHTLTIVDSGANTAVDSGDNTAAICHALQEYKPDYAAARLGVCHELRRINWYTTHPADEIWEMAQRRMRCGSPLQEVQVRLQEVQVRLQEVQVRLQEVKARMEAIADESGVHAGETSVHRLTAGQRVGSFETRVLPKEEWGILGKEEWGISAKGIIRQHTEAIAPCLPEGSAWDGDWMWDRKTRPRVW
ncbi:hypothetical protein BD626DRAFT_574204 [Schizophyllum amplum]|uniref:F-box domain-containing protein n=1 Tax=Schizophyllum amplum TaxID=97359 RepID=A0A550BYT3_9AGAR|nr:hypothetical protein BD626DRAFT_574204 [Auriculariopsis ampla]